MSLADKINALPALPTTVKCRLCVVIEELDDAERAALISALNTPVASFNRVNDRQLSELLRSEGYDISSSTIFRHRQNHSDRYV